MGRYEVLTDPGVNDGRPYRAYVPGRLQDIQLALPADIVAKVDRASRRIVAIDARLGRSPSLPALEVLVKSEAIASSYIEGHRVSAAELAHGTNDLRSASDDVRAVLGNIEATRRAVRALADPARPITLEDVLRIQSDLMQTHPRGGRRSPHVGMRTTQAVLIPPGALKGEMAMIDAATHVPPPASMVRGAMADLLEYINAPPVGAPPLVRAALAHAQFETIHPFPDGNGRTGRALIQAMLRRDDMLSHVVLPLSPYLAMNPGAYVDGLNAVRFEGDIPDRQALGEWIATFADCAYSAALNAEETALTIESIGSRWHEALRSSGVRTGAAAYGAASHLLGSVATTTRDVAYVLGTGEDTARTALRRLEQIGALSAIKTGDGTMVFVADEVAAAIARSQRDIAVNPTPETDDDSLSVRGVALRLPSMTPSGPAAPPQLCGAPMPRSRTTCNLPVRHAGWPSRGHRHLRR